MSTTLDATPSGASANSYLTVAEMDALLETFDLKALDLWDELEEDAQCSLLFQGTRKIDEYRQWGPRKVEEQPLAFPRSGDKVDEIPREVKAALGYFVEYKLLGDLEPIKRLQAEGVSSSSILGQSIGMSADNLDPDDASGLPAGSRQQLRRLWRAHWPNPVKNREASGSSDPCSFFG